MKIRKDIPNINFPPGKTFWITDDQGNLLVEHSIDNLKQAEKDLNDGKIKDKDEKINKSGLKEIQDIIKEFDK